MGILDSDMSPDVRFAVITDKIADHTCTRNEVERVLRAAHRKGWVLMMAYTEPSYKITSETSDGVTDEK